MQQLEWFVRILRSPLGAELRYPYGVSAKGATARLSPLMRLGWAPSCLWNESESRIPDFLAGYS
jgi:hypothetical protein